MSPKFCGSTCHREARDAQWHLLARLDAPRRRRRHWTSRNHRSITAATSAHDSENLRAPRPRLRAGCRLRWRAGAIVASDSRGRDPPECARESAISSSSAARLLINGGDAAVARLLPPRAARARAPLAARRVVSPCFAARARDAWRQLRRRVAVIKWRLATAARACQLLESCCSLPLAAAATVACCCACDVSMRAATVTNDAETTSAAAAAAAKFEARENGDFDRAAAVSSLAAGAQAGGGAARQQQ